MSDLHLWMQAWSNQDEMILTSVERVDKFDSSAIADDCPKAEVRMIEASLHQVLHRTTLNKPTENSATNKGTEWIRSMARDREVRPKKHVRPKFCICNTDQQRISK